MVRAFDGIAGTGFWRPGDRHPCWVCGKPTKWAWLDLGYQHPDCEMYPIESGDVKIVKARVVHCDHRWEPGDDQCTECNTWK